MTTENIRIPMPKFGPITPKFSADKLAAKAGFCVAKAKEIGITDNYTINVYRRYGRYVSILRDDRFTFQDEINTGGKMFNVDRLKILKALISLVEKDKQKINLKIIPDFILQDGELQRYIEGIILPEIKKELGNARNGDLESFVKLFNLILNVFGMSDQVEEIAQRNSISTKKIGVVIKFFEIMMDKLLKIGVDFSHTGLNLIELESAIKQFYIVKAQEVFRFQPLKIKDFLEKYHLSSRDIGLTEIEMNKVVESAQIKNAKKKVTEFSASISQENMPLPENIRVDIDGLLEKIKTIFLD